MHQNALQDQNNDLRLIADIQFADGHTLVQASAESIQRVYGSLLRSFAAYQSVATGQP